MVSAFNASAAKAQQVSDKEIKKNATSVSNSLAALSRLEPVTYEFNRKGLSNLICGVQHNTGSVPMTLNKWCQAL